MIWVNWLWSLQRANQSRIWVLTSWGSNSHLTSCCWHVHRTFQGQIGGWNTVVENNHYLGYVQCGRLYDLHKVAFSKCNGLVNNMKTWKCALSPLRLPQLIFAYVLNLYPTRSIQGENGVLQIPRWNNYLLVWDDMNKDKIDFNGFFWGGSALNFKLITVLESTDQLFRSNKSMSKMKALCLKPHRK